MHWAMKTQAAIIIIKTKTLPYKEGERFTVPRKGGKCHQVTAGAETVERFGASADPRSSVLKLRPTRYKRESSPLENLTSAPDSQESAWEVARASEALTD